MELVEGIVPPTLEYLLGEGGAGRAHLLHPTLSENWLVRSFLVLLEALLLKGHTRASLAQHE